MAQIYLCTTCGNPFMDESALEKHTYFHMIDKKRSQEQKQVCYHEILRLFQAFHSTGFEGGGSIQNEIYFFNNICMSSAF